MNLLMESLGAERRGSCLVPPGARHADTASDPSSLWSPLHVRTSPLILWLRWPRLWLVKLTSTNSQSGKYRGRNNPVLSESETPALPTLCFFSSLLSAQFQEFMQALSFPFTSQDAPEGAEEAWTKDHVGPFGAWMLGWLHLSQRVSHTLISSVDKEHTFGQKPRAKGLHPALGWSVRN